MKKKNSIAIILSLALTLPVTIMMIIMYAGTGCNVSQTRPEGPCDIYTAAGNPCVTAHSSTRALYKSYNGPLYQVMRQSDGKTLDIGVVRPGEGDPGGYADAAAHDTFCTNTLCWITILYDQSGNGNHLVQAPPGTFRGPAKGGFNALPIADMAPITIMGQKAYGVYIMPGMGLRSNDATGLAINDEPQGIYMVCDGKHFDSGCCFNYGNTSTNSRAVGRGTMETVYFGTSTAWGSGNGPGPWIMSDMEAGLFSGYDAKQNIANPTIDSWRFVTGIVNGGGGNKWEIWGANAQGGNLAAFYKGIRPHSPENDWYNPMHRKGAVQMGNGGDNGNGSAGTFYEGVMVNGFPDETTLNSVQANIVAARYDVQRVSLSRVTTFTPGSSQEVEATFTNTTGATVSDVTLSISLPEGWTALVSGSENASMTFRNRIASGAGMSVTFTVTSGATTGAGFITCRAEWKDQVATTSQRVRNVFPVKINEIRLSTGISPTDQFIELYNAGDSDVDISNWTLTNTRSEWAPVRLATVPGGTKLTAHGFYLLGLSASGLVASASSGDMIINVTSTTDFKAGQQIDIDGELRRIAIVGTAAAPMTTVFVPVSTGPWLTIPAGSANLPVTNATGFEVGRKIGIDMGGNYEVATVTAVGKAATQTSLAVAAKAGDTIIKVAANDKMTIGDTLTINTGGRKELIIVKRLINVVAAPIRGGFDPGGFGGKRTGEVELTAPLRFDHMLSVDVSGRGTGISFSPATRFAHKSGDAVQALGDGITLVSALARNHDIGAAVINPLAASVGYLGSARPNQWYGVSLSTAAGSIALMDASGLVIVDAIVYGSRQSNSSANGTITSPELATLEGDQSQGGCIAVAPVSGSGSRMLSPIPLKIDRSIGRFPDGADTDNNCSDFQLQNAVTLIRPAAAGSKNIKVGNVADFVNGQKIIIGTGTKIETAVITVVGTAGGTTVGTATKVGATVIPVPGVDGFSSGQTITIEGGTNLETAVVSSVYTGRRRFGGAGAGSIPMDSIKISMPLKYGHAVGAQVSGSGITLASPLTRAHDINTQIASDIPTPGGPNQYTSNPL
ncbi:MAG: lamin tail domain-containing protein [Bacteroidales bacterium]|nr:lamin tail domain-containing protein [Bacteroidales bacterium]